MINTLKYIISTKFSNTRIEIKNIFGITKKLFVYIVYFVYTCVCLYV